MPGRLATPSDAPFRETPAGLGTSSTAEPGLLLPDLRTLPPFDLHIVRGAGGRMLLRLANTVWNTGTGPLELLGQSNSASRTTHVVQRLYDAQGHVYEQMAGEFIWHPGHDHWHFETFTLYELWSLTPGGELDAVLISSGKVSYCVIDDRVVNRAWPGLARRSYSGCGRTLQGLSVGWGDTYASDIQGQTLDITGFPDDIYALRSTVNPDGRLVEADYSNNTAVVYLEIVNGRVRSVERTTLAEMRRCHRAGEC